MPKTVATAFSFAAAVLVMAAVAGAQNNCLECHSTLDDETLSHPTVAMTNDVHATAGLTCVNCHGGDASVPIVDGDYAPAKAPGTGYVGKPSVSDIPAFCGECHADADYMQAFDPELPVDQLARYSNSDHGTRLADGALDVAQCVSCHGAHGVLSPDDPESAVYPINVADTCGTCHADDDYMIESDLDTDYVDLYRESVHAHALYEGGDLSAPTCSTCHGNHGTPQGLEEVWMVCGTCHVIQAEFFAQGPHKEKFAEVGDPECVACHGNHSIQPANDQFLGVGEEQVCSGCHREGETGWETAVTLRADIEDLKTKLAEAEEIVHRAAVAGMEMSDAELVLIDANQTLLMARNVVHKVSVDALKEHTDEGRSLADQAQQMGVAALEELDVRRIGLGISVLFILIVVVGIYLKIREIESAPKP